MAKEKHIYHYHGPVQIKWYAGHGMYHEPYNWMSLFDGDTTAVSAAQAIVFLTYRAKEEGLRNGLTLNNWVTLHLDNKYIQEVK